MEEPDLVSVGSKRAIDGGELIQFLLRVVWNEQNSGGGKSTGSRGFGLQRGLRGQIRGKHFLSNGGTVLRRYILCGGEGGEPDFFHCS